MFTNQEIVAVIFRFINFAALIGITIYAFKKYALPDILLSIARKKNKQDTLYKQQADLEKQQHNLDILLQKDTMECGVFRTKIDIWKKNVALEQAQREQERDKVIQRVKQRFAQHALQKEQQRIQTIVTKAVVEDIEKSLSKYFQKQQHSNDYLNSILQLMNERTS